MFILACDGAEFFDLNEGALCEDVALLLALAIRLDSVCVEIALQAATQVNLTLPLDFLGVLAGRHGQRVTPGHLELGF